MLLLLQRCTHFSRGTGIGENLRFMSSECRALQLQWRPHWWGCIRCMQPKLAALGSDLQWVKVCPPQLSALQGRGAHTPGL